MGKVKQSVLEMGQAFPLAAI